MINETLMHQIMLRMLLVINAEVQEALEEVPNLATCFGQFPDRCSDCKERAIEYAEYHLICCIFGTDAMQRSIIKCALLEQALSSTACLQRQYCLYALPIHTTHFARRKLHLRTVALARKGLAELLSIREKP